MKGRRKRKKKLRGRKDREKRVGRIAEYRLRGHDGTKESLKNGKGWRDIQVRRQTDKWWRVGVVGEEMGRRVIEDRRGCAGVRQKARRSRRYGTLH